MATRDPSSTFWASAAFWPVKDPTTAMAFPEQFATFLFSDEAQRAYFQAHHGDLLLPAFWTRQQERLRAGIAEDLFPYPHSIRFHERFGEPEPVTR